MKAPLLFSGVLLLLAAVAVLATEPAPSDEAASSDPIWETRATLPEHRTEVSAATDGEHIYLIGGFGPSEEEGERASAPRTLWAYSPAEDAWEDIGEIPHGVHHTAFAYHEGSLYILGGFNETSFDPVENVHIYDIEAGTWNEGAPMPTPRGAAGFAVHDGSIHIIGGNVASEDVVEGMDGVEVTEDQSVNVHERYDPEMDSWEALAPMPTPRNHLGAAGYEGQIHAVLGRANGDYTMTTHEVYDAETDSWSEAEAVPTGRSGVAVLEHEGWIYTFGGENLVEEERRTFRNAERYNPATGEWEALAPMPTARHGLGAAVFDHGIYVIAGGPGPGFTYGNANEQLVLDP